MSIDHESPETEDISLVRQRDAVGNFYFKYFFLREIFTYVFSTDHKIIAKQYLFTGIFWALLGSLLSVIFRLQLGFPDMDLSWLKPVFGHWIRDGRIDPEFYLSLITMHGTIMMFFVLTASFSGTFSNFLIPLQIGARDMASGFINMLSYWFFFLSGILMFYSLFVETGPASGGWTFYPPLSALEKASAGSGEGMTWWLVSMIFFIVSTLLASINYITTVVNFRTAGMIFARLPLTIWAQFFTATLSLFSFPVLFAAILLLILDRSFGSSFFLSEIYIAGEHIQAHGGSPVLFQHLFWFLGHPEVYIAILPAFGITSEVISTNSRKPIFGYVTMILSMMFITTLSLMVWAHHMFVSGMSPFLGYVFSLSSFIIAVPSAVKVFNWLTTLWRGSVRFPPAMLFALGMVSLFISGGLTGLFVANSSLDIQVHDTYFVVAHFHLVMGSAAFFGFFAGIYHWFPKMFGRMMSSTLGSIHFWFTFAGVYLIFFPMHFMGMSGLPRRYYSFTVFQSFHGFADLNIFITIASLITFAAQLIFLFNFFYSIFFGRKAGPNPWNSNTLEWTTPVVLHKGNWPGELPVVYRWPYDYSRPGAPQDFIPQHISEEEEKQMQKENKNPEKV
jgi:cytochrome c oxidase subunit I